MRFLDPRSRVGRNGKTDINVGAQLATGFAGKCDRSDSHFFRERNRAKDVGRISAGGNRENDVSGFAEALELTGENGVKTVVVADRSERRKNRW